MVKEPISACLPWQKPIVLETILLKQKRLLTGPWNSIVKNTVQPIARTAY